ncbi:hypothetical protein [Porphyromonas crevioricanis]|uniref:Uncharacterized protein n=1 Tax=Porphyromonas crevioricanis JCM 15906 TaxID=1305617 RepID=S4NFL6_9PORP|nr:hypothetical protein [Porphyromonas crevioricanis]GAD04352.1 hypothetical protein PORCRE_35 [Porphyromonas crevioricanis JCM 15906]GAD07775.1 hypothetical protein PORCAN_1402 [Porphyromonas crevioricanis JCM 13913]
MAKHLVEPYRLISLLDLIKHSNGEYLVAPYRLISLLNSVEHNNGEALRGETKGYIFHN